MSVIPQPQDDRLYQFANRNFSLFSLQRGISCIPVDEEDERRLDALNGIIGEALGRTVLPPFPPAIVDEPAVLDCGFGKGAWIDELLTEYDDCEVSRAGLSSRTIPGSCDAFSNDDPRQSGLRWSCYADSVVEKVTGIDIYLGSGNDEDDEEETDAVQEYFKKRWNLNARFRDDPSSSRLRRETFDLINSQLVTEGINTARWPSYVGELRQLLKPRGWLQMVELDLCVQSDSGMLTDGHALRRWWVLYDQAMRRLDKNPRIWRDLERLMRTQGFEQVQHGNVILPIGGWDPYRVSLGLDVRLNIAATLEALSLWPFRGRVAGLEPIMSAEQYRILMQGARRELQEDRFRLYYRVYWAYGRRPRR